MFRAIASRCWLRPRPVPRARLGRTEPYGNRVGEARAHGPLVDMGGWTDRMPRSLNVRGPRGPIDSIWSWFANAPPKDPSAQWKSRCSAMEIARLWCADGRPAIPQALAEALAQNDLTAGFTGWDVDAEYVTALDGFRGEGRNHDLVIVGEARGVPTLVAVEAKAAESFVHSVTETIIRALKRSEKSKVPARVAALSRAVLGGPVATSERGSAGPCSTSPSHIVDPRIENLGYQLFTATVGTVIEADRRHCRQAVMLVHRFVEPHPTRLQQQAYEHGLADLNAFRALLAGADLGPLSAPCCVGPFRLHPSETVPDQIDLFLAVCETLLPTKAISAPLANDS